MPQREVFHASMDSRSSPRLAGYDYRLPGAYFITTSTWHRRCLFGVVQNGVVRLSRFGRVVQREWLTTLSLRGELLKADEFMVMPDHFHAIVVITRAPAREVP